MPRIFQSFCWILTYGFFTFLDSIGVRQSASAQFLATALCLIILIFYSISSFSQFDINNIIGKNSLSRDGLFGFFKALPFALQFFDGFEETPLLMEYTDNPTVVIPKGVAYSYFSVMIIAFAILFSGTGITPIDTLLTSEAPLMDGIDKVYGKGLLSDIIALLVVLGLLVNFFAFILFCSQQIQAVAEAGHLPSFLAYRHPKHGAPIVASVCCSCVGILLCAGFSALFDESQAQNTLVTAALMPAVLGYMLLLQCIVTIRNIENKQLLNSEEKEISSKELYILGINPDKELRFPFGILTIRFAQFLCFLFVIGLCCLATVSVDFMWGIIIIIIFGFIMFIIMNYYANNNTANKLHSLMDDEHKNGMVIDDMVSNRSDYIIANSNDDDLVTVNVHNPIYSQTSLSNGNSNNNAITNHIKKIELKRNNYENDAVL